MNALRAIIVACLCSHSSLGVAQTNPLAEHRQSVLPGSTAAYVVSASITSVGADAQVILDLPSARLIGAGVRSGDRVSLEIEGRSLFAHVAFRDELERIDAHDANADEQAAVALGMTLVVDRDRPGERVLLDASRGGGVTAYDVTAGQTLTIYAVRRSRRQGG